MYCAVLYCAVLYCTVLCCAVLYCTVLYCVVLYCTVMCFAVLYCTVLYCAALCCAVLCCAVLVSEADTSQYKLQYILLSLHVKSMFNSLTIASLHVSTYSKLTVKLVNIFFQADTQQTTVPPTTGKRLTPYLYPERPSLWYRSCWLEAVKVSASLFIY